jgi:glutaredoxin
MKKKMNNKSKGGIFIFVILVVIISILVIDNQKIDPDENLMRCIAKESKLYVLKTCGHCAAQKQILGDHLKLFNLVECSEERDECTKRGIKGVPAWFINDQVHSGVRSIDQLKELTGC